MVDGWIVADGVERSRWPGAGAPPTGTDGRIMPVGELGIPGAHNVSNALAAVAVALAVRGGARRRSGRPPRPSPASSTGSNRWRSIDGVRFVNDSQGTQPDAVVAALRAFDPPIVLIAGGRDKGIDLTALAPVVAERAAAAVLIGESGPALGAAFRAAGLARTEARRRSRRRGPARRRDRPGRSRRGTGRRGPATVLLSPAAASFDMFVDYAARGRAFKAAVAALAAAERREGTDEPRAARPAPRAAAPGTAPARPGTKGGDDRSTTNRTPVKSRQGAVRRERHQADYVILVVVVALTAIGILMVYSSSALRGYLSQDADTFATVGPQIQWAILGPRGDGR